MRHLVDKETIEKRLADLEREISQLDHSFEKKITDKREKGEQYIVRVEAIDLHLTDIGNCLDEEMLVIISKREQHTTHSIRHQMLTNHA